MMLSRAKYVQSDLVTGRKTTTRTTGSKVGKGSAEGYVGEEFNI
jgi:hypothetical protein